MLNKPPTEFGVAHRCRLRETERKKARLPCKKRAFCAVRI